MHYLGLIACGDIPACGRYARLGDLLFLCAQGLSPARRGHVSSYRCSLKDRKTSEGIGAQSLSYRHDRTEKPVEHLYRYGRCFHAGGLQGGCSPRIGSPDHAARSESNPAMKLFDCTLENRKKRVRMILDLAPKAIAKRHGRFDRRRQLCSFLTLVKIVSRLMIVIALASSSRSFRGATIGHSGSAKAPRRRRRRANRASSVAKGARTLFPKSARGRGQKSLLFCHGRYASPRFKRWKLGRRFYVICRSDRSFRRFRRVMAAAAI